MIRIDCYKCYPFGFGGGIGGGGSPEGLEERLGGADFALGETVGGKGSGLVAIRVMGFGGDGGVLAVVEGLAAGGRFGPGGGGGGFTAAVPSAACPVSA